MKKILLIIALLISGLGLNAQSVTIDDLEFRVTSETPAECEVSGYSGEPTDVTIPSKVTISGKEYSVTSIGDYAFFDCSSLTSIEIPSGVTSIGYPAFSGCSSLTSIEFEENSQLTSIGDNAFSSCSSLTSIEIPSGVTSIGSQAFYGCSGLTSVTFGENSQLTSIGFQAFDDCYSLESIEIPSGVTSIGIYAFRGCFSLTSIEIPSGVTSIGNSAFEGCSSLTSIVVESGNTIYDSRDNCNAIIETATNTLIAVCQNTVIPNTITYIGESAFEDCSSLTSIEIPSGVTSIGERAFYDCSGLTSVTFGENSQLSSIGYRAFYYCSSLTSIEIPSGVTSIGDYAFGICSSLTSIDFGENSQLSSIGYRAFYYCSSLTSIYCYAESVPETDSDAFYKCPSDMVIYVPAISVNAYEATVPWNNYTIMPLSYIVAAAANPEEAGVITGTGEYELSDTVTLTATANEGYKFVNWTENGEVVSEEAKYLFEITKDRNLVANFELLSYNVTASVNPENAGVVNGAGTYNHGEEVTLTATANVVYKFINWTENGEVVSEEAEYSFEITEDRNLVANFEEIEDPENPGGNEPGDDEKTCVVTAVANPEEGGSVSGAGTYKKDMTVTLKATAKSGYLFLNWTENGVIVSTENEYSFIVTKDINLIANFEKTTCNVTVVVNPEDAGTITGTGTYVKNMSVTLTAKANEGYKFLNWTENGTIVSTEREYSFVVSLDTDLVANFISTEGVEELASSFNIYPNPVNDKLNIITEVEIEEVVVYDVYGRLQSTVNGQQSMVIDVSDLNSGVYFVMIKTNEGVVTKRFVKE